MDIKLFYNNQQSIKLSYEIVESFRKQNFYIATSELTKLLGNLDTVAGYIFSQEDYKSLADEYSLFYRHYLTHRIIVIMFYRRIL